VNTALWIVTGVLAAVFLFAGANKVFIPRDKLAKVPGGGWVLDFRPGQLRIIGALEILAAAGLILPAVLGIAPILVPLAAVGLVLVMAGAIGTHLRRHEWIAPLANLIYLAAAVFVAWGRFGPESFTGS
jgi:uncharacterized membrane protein YphA (DoxX/SURF4 family)